MYNHFDFSANNNSSLPFTPIGMNNEKKVNWWELSVKQKINDLIVLSENKGKPKRCGRYQVTQYFHNPHNKDLPFIVYYNIYANNTAIGCTVEDFACTNIFDYDYLQDIPLKELLNPTLKEFNLFRNGFNNFIIPLFVFNAASIITVEREKELEEDLSLDFKFNKNGYMAIFDMINQLFIKNINPFDKEIILSTKSGNIFNYDSDESYRDEFDHDSLKAEIFYNSK